MKTKKPTRKALIKKLDLLVSKLIREREPSCVTCGSINKLGAGHLFSRKSYATRWDLKEDGNVHTQCWPCNFKHTKDTFAYSSWYIKKFGVEKWQDLKIRSQEITHFKSSDLQQMIDELEALSPKGKKKEVGE